MEGNVKIILVINGTMGLRRAHNYRAKNGMLDTEKGTCRAEKHTHTWG